MDNLLLDSVIDDTVPGVGLVDGEFDGDLDPVDPSGISFYIDESPDVNFIS